MYTNSPLVVYTRLSPNHSGTRNHPIDTVSIHCMAGNLSVETCGALFAQPTRQASSNYGIGSDGRIALYVEEKNRSWCTSSASNDHRAITIEVANSAGAPDWPVSEKAYEALLDLLTDICKRNNIKQLLWRGDKGLIGQVDMQNMTAHRWFAAKACPGNYLFNRHSSIATEVNKRLKGEADLTRTETIELFNELMAKRNPVYPDIKDVPKYWQAQIQEFLDLDILNGGTPREVNATDVNLSQDTVKALVLLRSYIDTIIPRRE